MLKHRFCGAVNRIALWTLASALEERHWNSFTDEEKAALDAATSDDLEVRSA